MAWKELTLLHDTPEEPQVQLSDGRPRDRGSLLQQVHEVFGDAGEESASAAAADTAAVDGPPRCSDGYLRRSPVQPYRTPEDYPRRRNRKIIMAAVILVLAVLLILALLKSGLLVLRLR